MFFDCSIWNVINEGSVLDDRIVEWNQESVVVCKLDGVFRDVAFMVFDRKRQRWHQHHLICLWHQNLKT
ncbi:hypothetical protein HanPSC8_Chr06g0265051 [Helianthus annuus]|nr:hypothetical protein HanPSC8_Chr06g0265051 [Helianthus annuus]